MPTSVLDTGPVVDDAALAELLHPGRHFPSADLVHVAAGLLIRRPWDRVPDHTAPADLELALRAIAAGDQPPAGVVRDEGRDFVIGVAAGVLSCRLLDHERRQKTAGTAVKSVPAGRLVYDEATNTSRWEASTPTRVVSDWSRKSRANMTRALSELDYAPMFAAGATPAMITYTYPGDWSAVAPSGKAVKRHLRTLMKRWSRRWHVEPSYLWKLEFQRRGAPHLHTFVTPPAGDTICTCHPGAAHDGYSCDLGYHRISFPTWLSETWAGIVGSAWCGRRCWERVNGGRSPCCERGRHVLAGTGIDYKEGVRARDPKRLAVYFTKHGGAAGGKEYQHRVPVEWRTPTTGPGRFWGYVGLRRVRSEVYVERDAYLTVRRTIRRLARSRRLTRELVVTRGPELVNAATGEVTRQRRKVTRRRKVPCSSGGLAGGFLLTNDGPALAETLARHLRPG